MQEYHDGLVVVRERKYRRAIDDLERLVVQRLFEMKKLGMNGVGTLIRHIYIRLSFTLFRIQAAGEDYQIPQDESRRDSVSTEALQ